MCPYIISMYNLDKMYGLFTPLFFILFFLELINLFTKVISVSLIIIFVNGNEYEKHYY